MFLQRVDVLLFIKLKATSVWKAGVEKGLKGWQGKSFKIELKKQVVIYQFTTCLYIYVYICVNVCI